MSRSGDMCVAAILSCCVSTFLVPFIKLGVH